MSAAQSRESSQQEEAERRGWAKRLVSKAGIEVWLKLFVNMRGSCSDDLERRGIAEKAINSGIGNTARMRHRHYHSVRPEDWAVVAGNPASILRQHQRPAAAIRGNQLFTTPAKNR